MPLSLSPSPKPSSLPIFAWSCLQEFANALVIVRTAVLGY